MKIHYIRDRYHPLHHLRRYATARSVLSVLDIEVWTRMPGVNWRVRTRLVRHASAFLLPGGVEPGIFCSFRAIVETLEIRSFWDVGANIGYYSWLVKSIAPGCALRLFEPEPQNVKLIRKTLLRAQLSGVEVREVAVSDSQSLRIFQRDQISGCTGGVVDGCTTFSEREWGISGAAIAVAACSLDGERSYAGGVDLMKVDVEGHEEAVLRGASSTIAADEPIIVFECFHGAQEISKSLGMRGYFIVDAETMSGCTTQTSNFLAFPPKFGICFPKISQQWQIEMARLGA